MHDAVTEVWRPQPAHSQVQALASSRQALPPLQPGQTNPFGQRVATRYSAQALRRRAETLLELEQGVGKVGHRGPEKWLYSFPLGIVNGSKRGVQLGFATATKHAKKLLPASPYLTPRLEQRLRIHRAPPTLSLSIADVSPMTRRAAGAVGATQERPLRPQTVKNPFNF
jgi:hypothetical protein